MAEGYDILEPESPAAEPRGFDVIEPESSPDEFGIGEEVRGLGRGLERGARRWARAGSVRGIANLAALDERIAQAESDLKSFDIDFPDLTSERMFPLRRKRLDLVSGIAGLKGERARLAEMSPELATSLSKQQEKIEKLPLTKAQEEFFKPETPWWKFFSNPVELTAITTAESLPSMATAILGSAVGPAGTAAGAGVGSFSAESAGRITGAMQKAGVDLKDPKQVLAWFDDHAKSEPQIAKAELAALGPASFDALTGGIAGRWLRGALGKGVAKVAAGTAKEIGVQMAGGGAGSIVGNMLAGEPIDWKDVVLEMAAEIAPVETVSNVRGEIQTGQARKRRLLSLREYRASPERAEELDMLRQRDPIVFGARATGKARDNLKNAVDARRPVDGVTVRLAAARDRMEELGYDYDEGRDFYIPKGGTDASSITSTTEMGVRGQGQGVGGTPPLQQQGQAAPPQTPPLVPAPPIAPVKPAPPASGDPGQRFLVPTLAGNELPLFELGEYDPSQHPVGKNFKRGASEKTGVVPGKELKGPYDRTAKGAIIVWERKDGSREVWGGRHKNELFAREKAAGRMATVPVQLLREVDGWTEQAVKIKDIETNIQDNQGSIYDYANVFREIPAFTYEVAFKRGLFRESKGLDAFRIARNATESTFTKWLAGDGKPARDQPLTTEHALAIANAAPGNEPAQKLGVKYAAEGRSPESVGNQVRRAAQEKSTLLEGELFGDTAFKDIEAEEDAASMLRREIRQRINAVRGAANNPEIARQEGVDVNDPASVNRRVAELSDTLKQLEGDWWLKPDLAAQVRQRAGTERAKVSPAPPVAPVSKPETALEKEQKALADERRALEEQLRNIFKKPPGAQSGPLNPDQVDQLMIVGAKYARNLIKSGVVTFRQATERVKAALPDIWDGLKEYWHPMWLAAVGRGQNADRPTPAEADKIISEVSGVAEPVAPVAPAKADPEAMLAVLDQFFDEQAQSGLVSYQTKGDKNYKYPAMLARHLADNGISRWQDMTYDVLMAFRRKILTPADPSKPLSVDTANSYLGAAKFWVEQMEEKYEELRKRDPKFSKSKVFQKVKGEEKERLSKYLSWKDPNNVVERLLEPTSANPSPTELRLLAAMHIALVTGLRPIEFGRDKGPRGALRLSQLNLDEGVLKDVRLSRKQQVGKMVFILPEVTVDAIRRYLAVRDTFEGAKESDFLFPISGGDYWKGKSISDNIRDYAKAKKLTNVSGGFINSYSFRYTLHQLMQDVLEMSDRDIEMLIWHGGSVSKKHYRDRNSPEWLAKHGSRVRELPHNQEFLRRKGVPREEAKEEKKPVLSPADVPKLRAGEKGTGDLLQGPDAPFNLAGESVADAERIAREKAEREAAAQAAAEAEKKNQPELPGAEPPREGQPHFILDTETGDIGLSFVQTRDNRVARELRVSSPGDMMQLLDSPQLKLEPHTRAVLKALFSSRMFQRAPGLQVAAVDYLTGNFQGEYIPGSRLMRFVNWTEAKTPIHEFFHHLFHHLQTEDRDFVREQRLRVITEELGKARNYAEIQPLEKLLSKTFTSDEFVEAGFPSELYHLANESEFFVWMMQDKALEFLQQPEQRGFVAGLKAFIARWLHEIKRLFGMTERQEDLWRQVSEGRYEYRSQDGQEFAAEREGLPDEQSDHVYAYQQFVEQGESAKIKYAAAEIPRLVREQLDELNEGVAALQLDAFNTKLYRNAKDKIEELVNAAIQEAQNSGNPYWDQPDAMPTATDPELAQKLELLGVKFNSENLRVMQREIAFENRGKILFWRRQKLAQVRRVIDMRMTAGLTIDPELAKTEEQLINLTEGPSIYETWDNSRGITVDDRAREIEAAFKSRPQNKAKAQALSLPFVRETFVDPMSSGDQMFGRFGRSLQAFKAAMADPTIEEHVKAAIANEFIKELGKFTENKRQFGLHHEAARAALVRTIFDLQNKLVSAKRDFGFAEFLLDDLKEVQGSPEFLGSWSNREAAEYLLQSYESVIAFAREMRTRYPEGGAEAILTRVLGRFADTPANDSLRSVNSILRLLNERSSADLEMLRDTGVNNETLARIIYVLSRSEPLENAMMALVRYGEGKIESDPLLNVMEIARLLETKDPIKVAEANGMIDKISARARSSQNAAEASLRFFARELERAQIALKALEYGQGLFDGVTGTEANPNREYFDLKRIAEDKLNYQERMILSTGKDASHYGATTTVFRGFKAGEIEQPDLDINAVEPVYLSEQNFNRIRDWFDKAQQYVVSFEEAESAWRADPAEKSPEELGFDRTVYNGLVQALADYPTYQDPIIRYFGTKADNSAVQQWMMGSSLFRQYLIAIRQGNGQVARATQTAVIRYGNLMADIKAVSQKHRADIRDSISAALKSHPEFHGDIEQYKIKVFNQVASEGRKFGSPLKPGMALPVSGNAVTDQDIALVTQLRRYYDDLRKAVGETQGRGIIEKRGSRETENFRVLIRKAASVGDFGLPMHISHLGDELIRDIQYAYDKAKAAKAMPVPGEDLTSSSTNLVVAFWNRNATSLARHILDAGREYRAMDQDGYMLTAELAAARELMARNDPTAIQSVEDAVAIIAKHFPQNTGLDVRRYVEESLFNELSQYYRNAGIHAAKMADLQMTEGIGGMTLASEFTQGAAQFAFPSDWYDFGAITDTDILHLTARVMHEPIIEVSKALDRMKAALQSEIEASTTSKSNKTNYKSVREAERIAKVIERLSGDFTKTWNLGDPDVNRTGWEFPPDMVKASLLASPPVNIRNVVLGGAQSLIAMGALHRAGQSFAMLNNLRHVTGIVARLPIDLLFSSQSPVGRKMQAFLHGPMHRLLPSAVEWISENIVDAHLRDVDNVQSLGFSLRDPFLRSVAQFWRDIAIYQSSREASKSGTALTAWRGLKNVGRTITAAYRQVGSEYFDKLINAQSLAFAGSIEQTLRGVAQNYGMRTDGFGRFDPSEERWLVTPNEFSNRLTYWGRQKNLAQFRSMLQGADISLEKTLYDYYQALKATKPGQPAPVMFKGEQLNALIRAILREFNAGDALNRPTGLSTSKLFRLLATFQGYPSDFLLKFIGQFNGARNQNLAKQAAMSLPTIFGYAVGAAILGLFSQQMTDWYRRKFQGATKRQVTILTKEFWTNWENAKDAMISAEFSTIPIIGDLVLFTRGVVVNNRGYEPTGRILAFGLANSAFNAVRGMWNLRNDGSNVLNPLRDFLLQYAGFSKEISTAIGTDSSVAGKIRGAESAMRFKAEQLGFYNEREAGNVKPGQYYSALSGNTEDLRVAMMKQDADALQAAFKQRVDFYAAKGIETPEKNALRDVRMMNPVLRAFGNKKPSSDEFDQVYSGLTSEQKQAVNRAVGAWDWAAGQLGINYNPVGSRSTGGGASGGILGGARIGGGSFATPRIAAGIGGASSIGGARPRRISLRSYRTRGTSRRLRTARRRLSLSRRTRMPRRRSLRLRRPRLSLA